jgi:hypothetical protein
MRRTTFVLLPLAFVAIGVVARLLPHAPNVAPITAMALFGAVYLNRRYALVLPLVAMALSDVVIGFYAPGTMVAVYASFAVSGLIGLWVRRQKSVRRVVVGTLAASTQFFLLSNFAGWLFGHGALFPQTMRGLADTYIAALPFFRNTLVGDFAYVAIFFGAYALALQFMKVQHAQVSGLPKA